MIPEVLCFFPQGKIGAVFASVCPYNNYYLGLSLTFYTVPDCKNCAKAKFAEGQAPFGRAAGEAEL